MRKSLLSISLLTAVLFVPLQSFAITTRVSSDSNWVGWDSYSTTQWQTMTPDGKFTVFYWYSSNLVPNDTNWTYDVFVKNTTDGTIRRASEDSNGNWWNNYSYINWQPVISNNWRYVVFDSYSTNLDPAATYWNTNIFVKDLQTNAIILITKWYAWDQANNYSNSQAISADGRYVLFQSDADNLVTGDTNWQSDVFVRDIQTATTERVNVSSSWDEGNNYSYPYAMSSDGRYVLFYSCSDNLVANDTNGQQDVFLRDRQLNTTIKIATDSNWVEANNYSDTSYNAKAMTQDGRYVIFVSNADNLTVNDSNWKDDVFIKDTLSGTTTLVSSTTSGDISNGISSPIAVVGSGRYVLFQSSATNLLNNNINWHTHLYIKNMIDNSLQTVDSDSNGIIDPNGNANAIDITPNGRYILFISSATNLSPIATNGQFNMFVKDMITGKVQIANNNSYGELANSYSNAFQISDDGKYIYFESNGDNLIENDVNGQQDLFINERQVILMGPPSVTTPTNNAYSNNNTILVQWVGATWAQIQVTVSWNTYDAIADSADWSRSIQLPSLPDGAYTLTAKQKYASDVSWSGITTVQFTVDTVNPNAPVIVTPIEEAAVQLRNVNIVWVWEPWATIRVKVWVTTKVATIDWFGNWNVWPFTVLPWYKYAVQAQQADLAGNQSAYSPIRTIYGVDAGVISINPSDYISDLIITKKWISDWSDTWTDKGKNITYSLTYDNVWNAFASWTMIYENIPTNTCFTVWSITWLQDDTIVEYSIDNGNTWTYSSLTASWQQDCTITNIRVVFSSPLAASTYIVADNLSNGVKNNTIGNNTKGIWLNETDGITSITPAAGIKTLVYWDINHDNMVDLATISTDWSNSKYYIFDGEKYDTWTSYYTWAYGWDDPCYGNCRSQLFIEDINHDWLKDIIAGNLGTWIIYFKNNGNGFDQPVQYDLSWLWMNGQYNIWWASDLNNDWYVDMVSFAWYFMWTPSGFEWPYAWPTTPGWFGWYNIYPIFSDLNHDGYKDIVFEWVYYWVRTWYSLFYWSGVWFWQWNKFNPEGAGTYNGSNFVIDFDKDGWDDVILPFYNGTITYYRNNHLGWFDTWYNIIPGWFPSSPGTLYGAGILDVNNDWLLDIVWGGLNYGSKIFLGNGTGTVATWLGIWEGFAEVTPTFGDVDHDGDQDMIFNKYNGYGYPMYYWRRNGTTYANPVAWSSIQYWASLIDINNDWYADIAWGWFGNDYMFALNNTKWWSSDGINDTLYTDFYHKSVHGTGTYTTVLSLSGSFQSRNKLIIWEELISWSNSITYSLFPVTNGICDTSNGAFITWSQSNLGSIDISTIPNTQQSICVEATLTLSKGVITPIINTLFATWTPDIIPAFTFDVKVTNGTFSWNTVTNTAYITSDSVESNTWNNIAIHIFNLPWQTTTSQWGWFGWGIGNWPVSSIPTSNGGNWWTIIIKSWLTPLELADKVKEITNPDATQPASEWGKPHITPEWAITISVKTSTPTEAIKSAIIQTTSFGAGQTIEIRPQENSALQTEKKCYTPKEVVDITLGKNTTNKDLLVYQALLHSYDITMFNDTDAYKPENWLKRYEAAKMFVNFAKHVLCREQVQVYTDDIYDDIAGVDPTLKPYIIEAYEYGILKWSKQKFRPLDTINRKEFVAALMRMFTNQNMDIIGQWNDWDTNYITSFNAYWLNSIVGVSEDINRYDMSKIIYKLYYNRGYSWTDKWYVLPPSGGTRN